MYTLRIMYSVHVHVRDFHHQMLSKWPIQTVSLYCVYASIVHVLLHVCSSSGVHVRTSLSALLAEGNSCVTESSAVGSSVYPLSIVASHIRY